MENLKQKIIDDQTKALREGDKVKLSTLRLLLSAAANKEIALRKKDVGLSDEEVEEVVAGEAKRRKDSAEEFAKGGRADLADKEKAELEILKNYLPPQISEEELLRVVRDGIREVDAKGMADFGKVMKAVMPMLKGKAPGDRVSDILKKELGGA